MDNKIITVEETKICYRCENEIPEDEEVYYDDEGKIFCEECYYKLLYMLV